MSRSTKARYRNGNGQKSAGQTSNPALEPWEPIRIDTSAPPVDVERFDLYFIDEKAYTAPKRVQAGHALAALEVAFEKGQAAAAWFIMSATVGEENIRELYGVEQLTHAQVQKMMTKLGTIYWGQVEEMVSGGKSEAEPTSSVGS